MAAGKEKVEKRRRAPKSGKPAAAKRLKIGSKRSAKTGNIQSWKVNLAVLEGAVEGVLIAEKESKKIRYVNASICNMLGYTCEELLAMTVENIHAREALSSILTTFAALYRGDIKLAASIPCQCKDGSVFWADISTARFQLDGMPCIAGFFSDISDFKTARDASEEAQTLFSSVFNTVPDVLGIQDAQHGIIRYNEAGYRLLSTDAESVKGKKCYHLIGRETPCDLCATSETYRTKQPARLEKFVESMGVWLDVRSYPILDDAGNLKGIVEHLRDITLQKRAEEELLKAEKLASLSVLAGGIAHDFNNLLGGIYGYIEMARAASQNPEVNAHLDATLKTMNRARSLTQQLLTFAKGGMPVRKVALLEPFLRETSAFALSGSSIPCQLDIAGGLWPCAYDPDQMGQVIDNILINAQQAMPMGGEISVSAGNVTLGAGEVHALPAGRYVKISIRDQGVGIPKELLGKIFDPFFTTKQRGSGLGLATSYSIVKQHGGTIEVESESGAGSVFIIFLPAAADAGVPAAEAVVLVPERSGRILIMDDEEVVRSTISAMLQHHGYETFLAADGTEALRIFDDCAASGTPLAAVILDLTVRGGRGGAETIGEIRKRDRNIPVFVASGYADDLVVAQPRQYGFTASITKPFTHRALLEILSKHL